MRRTADGLPLPACLLLTAVAAAATEPMWPGAVGAGPATAYHLTIPDGDAAGVPATIHLPAAGDGPWPVIVFSPGLGGGRDHYGFLAAHWAAHGYAAIVPSHADSGVLAPPWRAAAARAAAMVRDPAVLRSRPRQIAAIIDALPTLPGLAGRLDAGRVGVAGHSFGAWTTLMTAGLRSRLGDLSDPRPLAFAALSPQGPAAGRGAEAYAGIARPCLVATGSHDGQPDLIDPDPTHDGAWRARVYDLLPPGQAALAWLDGASHATFSGGAGPPQPGDPPQRPEHHAALRDLTLAWWDWRLRGHEPARAYLDEGWAAATSGARFTRR